MTVRLGFDIGSNSVGSAWIDSATPEVHLGVSVFPAGVDEADDKRGEPKNAKRRMTRRTRITLARRAARKRELRLCLISAGLLPPTEPEFRALLDATDPWELRRAGLDRALSPFEFGRVLLHLAQRRGALGLHIPEPDNDETDADGSAEEDGKVKAAIGAVRAKMLQRNARTFGDFISMVRAERVTAITTTDLRPENKRRGPREWRGAIRNKAGNYEYCADRDMIRDEFGKLWDAQRRMGGPLASLLTAELRREMDDEAGDTIWRHKGMLFGQRRQSWDLGTLGRCVLEPTERCAPHADMYASRYLVVETVNNLRIIERDRGARPLTPEERAKIKAFLSGPLGTEKGRKKKTENAASTDRPKRSVSVTDLRNLMGTSQEGWGRPSKTAHFRFNIENDEERAINTDWFAREIIHGAVSLESWERMPARLRDGLNRAILKHDPDQAEDVKKLRGGATGWAGLSATQADALVTAWKARPKPDAKRLNMSRRAVRNLLAVMDRDEPWPDPKSPTGYRWLTQIEARKIIAASPGFRDVTTGEPLDDATRRRYATGAKGATARDRYYMRKHTLMRAGKPVIGPDGHPLAEPPPAPLISNPVVRKAIHEVRRHLVEYMTTFGRKPDEVYVELSREAKMGKADADRVLLQNRLRNRIRNDIVDAFGLSSKTATQQRAAVDRVILSAQQGGICPLCGDQSVPTRITERMAAMGEGCEVAHIIPRASGGHNGLSNIVLAHTKCNRDMGRRTPRQLWSIGPGFDAGIAWIESIYGDVERPKFSEMKTASGNSLWLCYFTRRDDRVKIEQFKKEVKDIQEMTARQDAATKYATRQVMAYLADALYDGGGLPERGGERRIFATDGMWTKRLRDEWGLYFDTHAAKAKDVDNAESEEQRAEKRRRKEKNRGDHRHHAVDAVVITLCSRDMQLAWENREKQAEVDGINTADPEAMNHYRQRNPLRPPAPFKRPEELAAAVERAIFGEEGKVRPVSHRAVKRKLIGALHEETLFGPVLDCSGKLTGLFTAKKSVLSLDPNHLRMPRQETRDEAIDRLAARGGRERGLDERAARKWARSVVASAGYKPMIVDPPPGKSGLVRDVALRARLRECLSHAGLDPDDFSANEVKKLHESGGFKQASGVPIRSVVLLRTMSDPVVVDRKQPEYHSNRMCVDSNAASKRAYVGGNNHHIELRVDAAGAWSGEIVSAFEAAQRKLARLRALRDANVPKPSDFCKLSPAQQKALVPLLRAAERDHPMVDRRDDDTKGGRFIMSLCEGEMLFMQHKETGEPGYFVVAKLDKPGRVVVVPHWDARSATERKDSEGRKVPDSKREQFAVTPRDLKALAPPGHEHAVKIRVSPLGKVEVLHRD